MTPEVVLKAVQFDISSDQDVPEFREMNISMIYKKSDPTIPKNFRGVSLQDSYMKIVEGAFLAAKKDDIETRFGPHQHA